MMTCLCAHVAAAVEPPAWAETSGTDQVGTWAAARIGNEVVRLRLIPAGSFIRQARDGAPAPVITISTSFWLGETEVTQALWQQVMGRNPSSFRSTSTLPVEEVSWEDCLSFHAQLQRKLPALRATFPTEAQWEYACRAGAEEATPEELSRVAWHAANSNGRTHPVQSLPANAWGLYDLHGNVWEWCLDIKADYPTTPVIDPQGPATGPYRIVRGGGWSSPITHTLAGQRGWDMQDVRGSIVGLRLAAPTTND